MGYLIGVDEAGYGPNYGPLVIAATVWRIAACDADVDLYERLAPFVASSSGRAVAGALAIGDSKQLYNPAAGIAQLERGVLAAIAALGRDGESWRGVWQSLTSLAPDDCEDSSCFHGFERPVPIAADPDDVRATGRRFAETMAAAGIELVDIRARAIFPARFNALVEQCDSKGLALSEQTLALVAEMIEPLGNEPVHAACDKHGGRNRYAAILQQQFPDEFVRVVDERREESRYVLGGAARQIHFRFSVAGEASLQTALASMTAKYMRELAMLAFNVFWTSRMPGLRPTAGYPVDARRFRDAIAPLQRKLGIAERTMWRNR